MPAVAASRLRSTRLHPHERSALVQEFLKQQFLFRQNAAIQHGLPMPQDLTVVAPPEEEEEEEPAAEDTATADALHRLAAVQEQTLKYQRERDALERKAAEDAARRAQQKKKADDEARDRRRRKEEEQKQKLRDAEKKRDEAKQQAEEARRKAEETEEPDETKAPEEALAGEKRPWYKTPAAMIVAGVLAAGGATAGGLWGTGILGGEAPPEQSQTTEDTQADDAGLGEEQILAMLRRNGYDVPPALGKEILRAFELDPGFRSRFLAEVRKILEEHNGGRPE